MDMIHITLHPVSVGRHGSDIGCLKGLEIENYLFFGIL